MTKKISWDEDWNRRATRKQGTAFLVLPVGVSLLGSFAANAAGQKISSWQHVFSF